MFLRSEISSIRDTINEIDTHQAFEKDGDRWKTSFIQNNLLRVDTQYYYYIYYLLQDFR